MTKVAAPTRLLSPLITAGYSRVLVIRLARLGFRDEGWPRLSVVALASASLAASLPVLLEGALWLLHRSAALQTLRAVLWVVALSAFDVFALVCAWRAWVLLDRAGASLDELIGRAPGRERVTAWFERAMSWRRQLGAALAAALTGCVLLAFTQPAIEARLEMGLMSYVAVAWTALIAGNCAYWVVVLPELARRVLRLPELHLVWHSPASTPAIAQLSSGFGFITVVGLGAFVGIQVLALKAAQYGSSEVLDTLARAFPILFAIITLIVGIAPHWWLYLAVRDVRRGALRALRPLTGESVPRTLEEIRAVQQQVELYRLVETSPGLPFSTSAIVQYAAAVLGTMIAFLLGT